MSTPQHLVDAFAQAFIEGRRFQTIIVARQQAEFILGERVQPGTPKAKLVDESLERGLIRAATAIVRSGNNPQQVYEQLVDLYQRQPILGTRSSTSVAQQAYSTPLPIAYLAAQMAEITPNTTVYEPTAGHGSLLLSAKRSKVIANELNPERAADLREQGYTVSQFDAANYLPSQEVDVVIANPPFGSIRNEDGTAKVFEVAGAGVGEGRAFVSTQVEHAIALNSLKAMKDDGRAVLILGGKMGDERSRSLGYNSQLSRAFYYALYNQYNVTRHISIDGKLYSRQGAGFPIDVIAILGRGKSKLTLPAAEVPRIYLSFDELKELLPHEPVPEQQKSLDASFDRIDAPRPGSGVGATEAERDLGFRRVPGATVDANRVDDPAVKEPVRDAGIDRTLHQFGGDVIPSLGAAQGGRTSELGERPDTGKPVFSGEAEIRFGNQFSSASDRGSRSFKNYRADNPRGMAATHGSRTEGGLDLEARSTLQKTLPTPVRKTNIMAPQDPPDEPQTEQPRQLAYVPVSNAQPGNTLVPANMRSGIANALARLEQRVGSLDEYVADRLNYGAPEQLHQLLNAEQVDATALAISNLEKRRGFIIGDQTGVGKGRVVAAVIRYAKQTGRIPIFVTKDPVLYADMIRDLADIGMTGFKPFATNSDLKISLPDGRELKTSPISHNREMQELLHSGGIRNYDAIFTTYSQMQSVKGEETDRRHFLRAMAPKAIMIMDESHEAGGTKDKQLSSVPDRAELARELLTLSQGGFYSSATFAKRPDVMDLYALTDMGQAVSTNKLVSLVERGGIPMQQGLATMLTESGQYIRRERSYEGVSFDAKISPVDKDVAENMSSVMAAILDFDRIKQQAVKRLDKDLKAEAKSLSHDNSTGAAGADSTNFTSIMHNLVEQSLLAMKAEATVQESLAALRNDEKPVIALASTMGSFIGDYARMNDLKPGDSIDLSFQDLLKRYLDRNRDILVKNFEGNKTRHRLTDEELGLEGVAQYEAALERIDETDLSGIPISPIDYIKARLGQEGYRVNEVTGRTETVDYDAIGNTTYSQRTANKAADRNTIEAFNSGEIDVTILNRSGATGISLHASERFADQRQRHMIVVQPEKDVNQFMQMLGRIHRTGQVVLPKFTLLMADIPAEKRPNAVLLKKMASLNANTTAARRSGISLDSIPDFLNDYGDQVVAEIVGSNPQLNHKLAYPLKGAEEEPSPENAIARVTGRIPLLPLAEQEAFYDQLERDYTELVERTEAMGESILEANSLDLDAKTVARMEVIAADLRSDSPFTSGVYLEVVDAKAPRKPLTTLEVANVCRNSLSKEPLEEATDYDFVKIGAEARANAALEVISLKRKVEEYRRRATNELSESAAQKLSEKLDKQLSHVQGVLQDYLVGERVRVVTSKQNVFYGVVGRVWETGSKSDNPIVPANWRMQILLADQTRELTVPLSKVNTSKDNAINILPQERDMLTGEDVYDLFDLRQTQQRQSRQIFTGNILRAYEAFNGKLVNFTDNQGKIRQGVLTPQGFDIEKVLESEPVRMPTDADTIRFITEVTQRNGSVKTLDELLTIRAERRGDGFVLQTPKAKDFGGQYYLAPDILAATGSDFFSVGDRMQCVVPKERIDHVLEAITRGKGLSLAAFDQRDKAREMLGIKLPKLEQVELGFQAEVAPEPIQPALPESLDEAPTLGSDTEAFDRRGRGASGFLGSWAGLNSSPAKRPQAPGFIHEVEVAPLSPLSPEGTTPVLRTARGPADWLPSPPIPSAPKPLFDARAIDTNAPYIIESDVAKSADTLVPDQPMQIEDAALNRVDLENSSTTENPESKQPFEVEPESRAMSQSGGARRIANFRSQIGAVEKNVAKLLHQAGLAEKILQGQDFHLRVENEPYTPLSIERHGQELYLTHFLEDGCGDLFIDSEMVFQLDPEGQLALSETAVQNPLTGGEYRRKDRGFGLIFSKNLLEQGFAEAALSTLKAREQLRVVPLTESPQVTSSQPEEQSQEDLPTLQPDQRKQEELFLEQGKLGEKELTATPAIGHKSMSNDMEKEERIVSKDVVSDTRRPNLKPLDLSIKFAPPASSAPAALFSSVNGSSPQADGRDTESSTQPSKSLVHNSDYRALEREKLSPLLANYAALKDQYHDALVLLRVGDFYEAFFQDAVTLSSELDLVLASKNSGSAQIGRVPMSGVPHHALSKYKSRLEELGHSVVVSESELLTSAARESSMPTKARTQSPSHEESSKPLEAKQVQLSLFDIGLNLANPPPVGIQSMGEPVITKLGIAGELREVEEKEVQKDNLYEQSPPASPALPKEFPQLLDAPLPHSPEPVLRTPSLTENYQALVEPSVAQPKVQEPALIPSPPAIDHPTQTSRKSEQASIASADIFTNDQQPLQLSPGQNMHRDPSAGKNLAHLANQVRDLDLEIVALGLGLERDRHDKHKWRGNGQIISINGGKFYDHLTLKGGGGAIDLTIHVQNCQYREAVKWLSEQSATPLLHENSPKTANEPVIKDEPKYLALPTKDERTWPDVRRYLVETRGLPEPLIDQLHDKGLIYSDIMHNAVFLRHAGNDWRREEVTGASLRGTEGKFHGLSPGSDKNKGWFWFSAGKGELSRVVLVESAIDAMSRAALDKREGRGKGITVYLSADGAGAIPTASLKAVLERGGRVDVAFDADGAGDQMAERILKEVTGATRLRPTHGKDWNEQLLHLKKALAPPTLDLVQASQTNGLPQPLNQKSSTPMQVFQQTVDRSDKRTGDFLSQSQQSGPSLDTLRQWYRVSRSLGSSQQYLNRITEVANQFKAGQPLSDKAHSAILQDFRTHKLLADVVQTAQKVLRVLGKPVENAERYFKGQVYELHGTEDSFTVQTAARGIILSIQQGQVQSNQLTENDLQKFSAIDRTIDRNNTSVKDSELEP